MLTSQRIKNRHLPVQTSQFECFLDIDVVLLLADERVQRFAFLVMVLLKQSQRRLIQRHNSKDTGPIFMLIDEEPSV